MKYDITIIGAGIIGLATAYEILEIDPSLNLLVIDKESNAGSHQSGHNSGVMHSGIYYKPGSLKAKNCIEGYHKLIDFCNRYEIPYELCGKIIVATTTDDLPSLNAIYENGIANGLKGIKILNQEETLKVEPYVTCVKSILVPQAGIIDYMDVVHKLVMLLKSKNVDFAFDTKVINIKEEEASDITILTNNQSYHSHKVITCGGLYSDKLTQMSISDLDVKIVPFRGEYYSLSKEKEYMVNHLIYPVPNPEFPFLGVHYTRKKKGGIEAGPNAVLAFRREGYSRWAINLPELIESLTYSGFLKLAAKFWKIGFGEMYRSFSSRAFAKALSHLIKGIDQKDLKRSTAGVRAQALYKDGSMVDDFLIKQSGNIVHVVNAPSPAATSSLAIGRYIAELTLNKNNEK